MDIQMTPHGAVTLVEVRGRIVDGEPAETLRNTLRNLVKENKVDTIIDLSGVEWFDSTAIGILVCHYVAVTQRAGQVVLLRANDRIKTLMKLVRLDDRFGWAQELDQALAWFETPAA